MRQRNLSPRENKEQRQEAPSSSSIEKDNAVQAAVSAKAKRGDKQIKNEILEKPGKEKQNKLKRKREENEGIGKKKSSVEELGRTKQTHWGKIKSNAMIKKNIKEVQINKEAFDKTKNETCEGTTELNEYQGQHLRKLIERKGNRTGIKLEPTHLTKHKIDVQGHEPINQRYYYVSPKIEEYMYDGIDKMLEEDLIETSNSDWSNPVVMIKKRNGKYRFCLDFRKVNKITKKDLYLIPIMAEILDALTL